MLARDVLLVGIIAAIYPAGLAAQGVRVPVPYNGQLRTDPDVGNVQGIQRYGRPLRTDPDQGEGFSYHVYPVANDPNIYLNGPQQQAAGSGVSPVSGTFRGGELNALGVLQAGEAAGITLQQLIDDLKAMRDAEPDVEKKNRLNALLIELQGRLNQPAPPGDAGAGASVNQSQTVEQAGQTTVARGGSFPSPAMSGPYPPAFDWTDGIRDVDFVVPLPPIGSPADIVAQGVSVNRARGQLAATEVKIYNQPLIQVRARVVEVVRGDSFNAGTILEYVSNRNGIPTLTSGQTANTQGQNFRGISRLILPDLTTSATAGTGTLLNLTTEHINALVQLLATEASADVVTAPEVITLNGQNVEFVSGEKVPFQLGQNVIQGTNNNIQQFFYKHVGTMISVTPRIVNWGLHGQGQGEQPILAHDVQDWPRLARWMRENLHLGDSEQAQAFAQLLDHYSAQREGTLVPFSVQGAMLEALNDYSRQSVEEKQHEDRVVLIAERIIEDPNCESCRNWRAEDCTIDLSVVVRLSDKGSVTLGQGGDDITGANVESNVRAISNVIQLKSGHGVVMAGLIGEREEEQVAKVPVLGDIPVVGFIFRNKVVGRLKTEVLIFLEAQVLDPDPYIAREESARNFLLSQPYVAGELLDNPLDYGMYRVGFGSYLPPHSHGEYVFWERFGRKLRKQRTHLDDAFE